MKLISNFHDFYDQVQVYGSDPKLVYLRHRKEIDTAKISSLPDPSSMCHPGNHYEERDVGVICFCGRTYPFLKFDNLYFYDIDKFRQYLEARIKTYGPVDPLLSGISKCKEIINKLDNNYSSREYYKKDQFTKKTWDKQSSKLKVSLEAFREFDSPVFMVRREAYDWKIKQRILKIEINPILKTYGFEKVIDPFTAYQEIEMFIGNDLVTQKDPNPKIPDELKAQSHGFDKWSFRKPPGNKK